MTGTEHWRQVASLDDVGVRDAILSGYADGKPFTPYVPTIDIGRPARVLDFGCGLGRNLPYLTGVATEVVGFDLPEMIERVGALDWPGAVSFESDWDRVREQRFDLVFASLVFQHVEPAPLERYLADVFTIAPCCYLLSRGRHDFGGATLQYLPAGVRVGDGVLVDHDPQTNNLAQLGPISGAEITSLDDDRVYETVLGAG